MTIDASMPDILLINGPNLDRLGQREPERYGHARLEEVVSELVTHFEGRCRIRHTQSASESELVRRVHAAAEDGSDWIVINPGAFTHTSIALRDAVLSVGLPLIEVHISNVFARESFRHQSYFSDIARTVIIGAGTTGYRLAIEVVLEQSTAAASTHT